MVQQLQASEWCFGAAARVQRVVYRIFFVVFWGCREAKSGLSSFGAGHDQDTGAKHHRI